MAKSWQSHGKVMAKSWQSHGKVMAKSWQSHGNVENLYGLGETGSSRVAALSRLPGCVASVCTSISSADRRLVEGTTWT